MLNGLEAFAAVFGVLGAPDALDALDVVLDVLVGVGRCGFW